MKKQILLLISALFAVGFSNAQTQLSAGDLMFIGFQSGQTGQTAPDRFAFILLKEIASGTTVYFTDNAVLNQSPVKFCTNEGLISWTSEVSLAAGTVVTLAADSTASTGAVSGGLSFSQSGDQIISFQINGTDTVSIGGFSSTGWLGTCSSGCGNTLGNNSATCLPAGLQAQVNVMDFPNELNNSYFSLNSISGTPDEIRALLLNPGNWVRSDELQNWPVWSATVTNIEKTELAALNFLVFPNPSKNGLIFVEMKQASELSLFSLQGKELYRSAVLPGKSSLQFLVPESGLYLLRTFPQGQAKLIEIFR